MGSMSKTAQRGGECRGPRMQRGSSRRLGRSQTPGRSSGRPSARVKRVQPVRVGPSVIFGVRHRWQRGLQSQLVQTSMRLNDTQSPSLSSTCTGEQRLPLRSLNFFCELGFLGVRLQEKKREKSSRHRSRSDSCLTQFSASPPTAGEGLAENGR